MTRSERAGQPSGAAHRSAGQGRRVDLQVRGPGSANLASQISGSLASTAKLDNDRAQAANLDRIAHTGTVRLPRSNIYAQRDHERRESAMDGNSQQEAFFASTRGTLPVGSARDAKETLDQSYLRQIRNAVVVIAIAACLPYVIWAVYHLTH